MPQRITCRLDTHILQYWHYRHHSVMNSINTSKMTSILLKKLQDIIVSKKKRHICTVLSHSHLNFCSLEFSLLSLPFFMGRKCARTCINCRKLTRSLHPSSKKACTMRSPKGFMASSGIRKKSSRLRVPQSPRSKLVNLLYRRSIWLGVTVNK
jgi:hypothetical protein